MRALRTISPSTRATFALVVLVRTGTEMDLRTLFSPDCGVGIHDIRRSIRRLVASVGTLLCDGARWPAKEIAGGPPEWQV
jgi:hypothetical protein